MSDVNVAVLDDVRFVVFDASPRLVRDVADCICDVVVPARATTRRADEFALRDVGVAARAVPPVVAERADVVAGVAARAVTRRADALFVAARAYDDALLVALRAVDAVPPFDGVRATTFLVVAFAVFVRARTFIWAPDWVGLVPGFNWVRIVLFIYGYRLLYVFALT